MKLISLFLGIISIMLLLTGCAPTYSVILNHTEGTASDLVDETQTPSNDVKPNLTIPVVP